MDGRSYFGIYISKRAATVVCLGHHAGEYSVKGCFAVAVEQADEQNNTDTSAVAALIAKTLAEKFPAARDCEIAVALDCAMFMQHNLHSEFSDPKQIASTIRFDTEESLAMDVSEVAIAFTVSPGSQAGSDVTVFTAQKKILSDIILSLQGNKIDPVTVEPDVSCLSRFVRQKLSSAGGSQPYFGLLSRRNGYFIIPVSSGPQSVPLVRTFLVGAAQDRGELLGRELPLITGLADSEGTQNCFRLFDSTDSVDFQQVAKKLGMEVEKIDLAGAAVVTPDALNGCADMVDLAIAYGAALSHFDKAQNVNFRSDFMPYQGAKIRLQKALKFLSVVVTILLLAAGLYFQTQLMQKNKYRGRLSKKFGAQYSLVMMGEKLPTKTSPAKKLAAELRRIKDVKSGQLSVTGEESVSAKLTLIFEAFNKCAERTGLSLDSVSITSKSITIAGETSSRDNTLKLFDAIKAVGMDILQQRLDSKAGRDNFRITVVPKK
jgi:hypothetical protein